jgi:hypothetical protein
MYVHSVATDLLALARSMITDNSTRYSLTVLYGRSASTFTNDTIAENYHESYEGSAVVSTAYYLAGSRIDITAASLDPDVSFQQWVVCIPSSFITYFPDDHQQLYLSPTE